MFSRFSLNDLPKIIETLTPSDLSILNDKEFKTLQQFFVKEGKKENENNKKKKKKI